ncbi:DUF1501 domain-containing protein [Blastopirellula marina]|uniref:DUF1501 domain-containing protein n=1 Tax=Blastopirellula marina TaxID=124 RepID=A0A2S8GTN6_9BACT|nr:DUF1501 domain-containing protein [Blastopirellula marina]PQO47783.1 DUF1501 domain-containing protein [Blastopirellula marina]
MAMNRTCDGVRRRDFLKVGVMGGIGLNLATYMSMAEAGQVSGGGKAKAGIFVNLNGGPTHIDTFDPKPNAPSEFRGEFNPIKTNVPGIEISEHLPKLAQQADKYVILRGVSHTLAAHNLGTEYVNTGTRPLASLQYPSYGSVITKELGGPKDLPSYVAIPRSQHSAGYLGVKYAPLATNSTPKPGQAYSVRGISLSGGLTIETVERRHRLLADLDQTFAGFEADDQLLDGLDRFSHQAHAIITSKRARAAFDVSQESPAFAKDFQADDFSMSCLLAIRLVESGVRFVTITNGGWDTHQDGFARLKDNLLPKLDNGLAALFNGLHNRGLLDSTGVFVTGEFGRTPKINARGGRDHYPRCMTMLMAGGGVQGGQVIGESDETASLPKDGEGFKPDDVAASFFYNLGIDHSKEYHTNTGRPITIVRDGKVIRQLFS